MTFEKMVFAAHNLGHAIDVDIVVSNFEKINYSLSYLCKIVVLASVDAKL